ncbi:hypothetical protein EV178_004559 [Coemansia sp. RSA 1646]|nr:hypothetical protein EV178_004559 [Coemansia sp. RSA 1646]
MAARKASEITLALLKPDLLANPEFVKSIINEIRNNRKGIRILQRKRVFWTQDQARSFYAEHSERFFYGRLVSYMTSGPFEAMALGGNGFHTSSTNADQQSIMFKGALRVDRY